MAPIRSKKRKSSSKKNAPAHSQLDAPKSPLRTPDRSPQKHITRISESQKQALIDNLQLEITERARKLRAQYALQAQSLRTRIELRINRIPTSLRQANINDLYEKYQRLSQSKQRLTPEVKHALESTNEFEPPQKFDSVHTNAKSEPVIKPKGTKRNSDALESTDKENASGPMQQDIPNPKKRAKVLKGPSRQVTNPSTVLSPKSANSRTLPQSPIKPNLNSPQKPFLSRPASPLKPLPTFKAASPPKAAVAAATASLATMVNEKPKVGRPKAGTGLKVSNATSMVKKPGPRSKRGAQGAQEPEDVRKVSNTSNISNASTGTTIVKGGKRAPATAAKKDGVGMRATGKKVTVAPEAPQTGRRVLRKRA